MIHLQINLSAACVLLYNVRCIMCPDCSQSWKISKKTVEEIISFFPYRDNLYWRGGEAFLFEYYEDMFMESLLYPDISHTIDTNGLLLDEKWAEIFSQKGISLNLSIHGVTKKNI